MSFRVYPTQEILVRPALPEKLSRLPELGMNLMWSWQHAMRAVFRRLDPAIWKDANHNPVALLGRVSQETLERAAQDPRYLAVYRSACDRHDAYLAASNPASPSGMLVAYFSMEYALLDCMPIYSGGLGVLSGDHLKASSDAMVPLVAVGLLYQKGYLQQALDAEGWQQEKAPVNDFYSLPVTPVWKPDGGELVVGVKLGSAEVYLKVWRIDVGRVKLYLLDANIPQNTDPAHRDLTSQLYGGDLHKRICQEIILGIGGLRALKALGLKPTVFHMNEGHSAFLAIERIRVLMAEEGLSFEEAREASRTNNVFTTHTSVPAGIDLFDMGMFHEYFHDYARNAGIEFDALAALGKQDPRDPGQPFSMAIAAIRTSAYRNAVSRLHREVSQRMWESLWPGLPVEEVPIAAVTNGVHLLTWINGDFADLYDQYLQPDWREGHGDAQAWSHVAEIPAAELWDAHRRRKRLMIQFVRERAAASARARNAPAAEVQRMREVLDPEALTIGFARRFATYKRATLIFRDLERLARILTDPAQPVQIVIAGKAHPLDVPGKTLIREIVAHSRRPELARRIVFVEDYGLQVGRELVGGVDVWLNTPRRGEEACGTSGMKAAMNGALNLSILDGWFDEAAEESGGWAIGGREPYSQERDDAHAASLYSLLESEIVPLFYEGREHGVPVGWMERVQKSIRHISSRFNCQRMIGEYARDLYGPAHAAFSHVATGGFSDARHWAGFNRRVAELWPQVRFLENRVEPESQRTGLPVRIQATVHLAGLAAEDVRVEALVGRIGADGDLEHPQVILLEASEERAGATVFEKNLNPPGTGRLGVAMRVSPNHGKDALNRPCNGLLKWAGRS